MADSWGTRIPCQNHCGKRAKRRFIVVEPGTQHFLNDDLVEGIEVDTCVARCARELIVGTLNGRSPSGVAIRDIGPATGAP